jgi:hypothetical protein
LEGYLSKAMWDEMFKHITDPACKAASLYTYSNLLQATKSYPDFANSADDATNKRELAAFLAQISHETTGGWATAPDGPYAWGLCWKYEGEYGGSPPGFNYCDSASLDWPCATGKSYYGRGPMQLSWNYK